VPFEGDITDCDQLPLRAERYRCGAVFALQIEVAGRTIAHLGSAELLPSTRMPSVDLVLLTASGWTTSHRLPERVIRALEPRAILLSHWDNFFRPLDQPAQELPLIQMSRLADELAQQSRDTRIGTLPMLGELFL
jgi:L-ascorbate metabolism protein UlaG (beta-lactamase superfamily)